MGCHGTSGFLKTLLRSINIPVKVVNPCRHSHASFPTLQMTMTHSDDIYSRLFRDHPGDPDFPPTTPLQSSLDLLIPDSQFQAVFEGNGDPHFDEQKACLNVGFQTVALAVHNEPRNYLMSAYCDDFETNATHADGVVFEDIFSRHPVLNLTVPFLERAGLWTRLESKRQKFGCSVFR
jgi:hypothetical protein